MNSINGIQPLTPPLAPPQRPASPFNSERVENGIDQFASLLSEQVQNVNQMQGDADQMVHSLLTGGDISEAEVLTAVQKADLAFRMLLQVRNKLIEAYREVQQIQV